LISDFLSDDFEKINKRKHSIKDDLWDYVYNLGLKKLKNVPFYVRDGNPLHSYKPKLLNSVSMITSYFFF
jgi:hypothetical protein